MAEMKDTSFGVWKKPSNNSKNRSYRDGKPKDTRLLFREREVAKGDSRHKERHNNESHKKERRIHSHKRIEEEEFRRHRHRLSPSVRKFDSRESRISSKARRDSNDELNEKRSKKHKCKHRRQHEDEKPVVDEPVVSINDDKIKKCRHTHRHRHHKKCKHRHHEEKPSSSPKAITVEVRTQERCSPSRMQKPSERMKTNTHVEVTPLDSKEIYAEGDKIFVNINFNKVTTNEPKSDITEVKNVSEQPGENKQLLPSAIISSDLNTSFSKPGEPPKKDVKLVSKSKTEFDIFWDDNSDRKSEKSNQENSNETDTVTRDISFDGSPKRKPENESNFVPRSLLTDVKSLSLTTKAAGMSETPIDATPPQTPPTAEERKSLPSSPDQTMPTPTQDESQVDSLRDSAGSISNSINSPVTPLSNAVTTPKGRVTDIYDPEAPLESPENDFDCKLVKNGNKTETPVCNRSPLKKVFSPEKPKNDVLKMRSVTKNSTKVLKPTENPIAFSSQVSSTTVSATSALSNLMRLLPQTTSPFPTNPPPNSLIAQIKQTVNQQPKGAADQQQLHQLLQTASSITSILKNLPVANQTLIASKSNHSHDVNEVVDMDVDSPRSPAPQAPISSTTSKLSNRGNFQNFSSNPAIKPVIDQIMRAVQKQTSNHKVSSSHTEVSSSAAFKRPVPVDSVNKRYRSDNAACSMSSSKTKHQNHGHHSSVKTKINIPSDTKGLVKRPNLTVTGPSTIGVKLGDVAVVDDVPSSAVELLVKEKYLKKLNRQERVVEEVKLVLKPYYQRREVTKEEYKEILRKSVPKICHSKTGEINPVKIKQLVEEYIKRMKHLRKKSKIKSTNSNANVTKL